MVSGRISQYTYVYCVFYGQGELVCKINFFIYSSKSI